MGQISLKTHLIIDQIDEEFYINWCGKLKGTNPLIKNGLPVFIIVGALGRMELNTIDIHRLEENAKRLTYPKGKEARTVDSAHIYLKEVDGNEILMATVTHKRIKHFIPITDKFGYR